MKKITYINMIFSKINFFDKLSVQSQNFSIYIICSRPRCNFWFLCRDSRAKTIFLWKSSTHNQMIAIYLNFGPFFLWTGSYCPGPGTQSSKGVNCLLLLPHSLSKSNLIMLAHSLKVLRERWQVHRLDFRIISSRSRDILHQRRKRCLFPSQRELERIWENGMINT